MWAGVVRERLTSSECPCLVHGYEKIWLHGVNLPETYPFFLPSPFFSLCVHVECLPGTIKGTGRQRSCTSKPSPPAVFSLTIHPHTHTHTHTHTRMHIYTRTHTHRLQCACTLTQLNRKLPKSLGGVRLG